jgi:hypothetical protein
MIRVSAFSYEESPGVPIVAKRNALEARAWQSSNAVLQSAPATSRVGLIHVSTERLRY